MENENLVYKPLFLNYKPRPPFLTNGRVAWQIPEWAVPPENYDFHGFYTFTVPEGWKVIRTTPKNFRLGSSGELILERGE